MTHIIKAEIGLKCPPAVLRSAASLQERTHFALLVFCHPKVRRSKLGFVCKGGHPVSALKHVFSSIFFHLDIEHFNLITEYLTLNQPVISWKLEGFTSLAEGAIACAAPYTEKSLTLNHSFHLPQICVCCLLAKMEGIDGD